MMEFLDNEFFDFEFALEILPDLLEGLQVTATATLLAFVFAILTGLFMALGRRSTNKWLSVPTAMFVEFIRSTPLLVQLYIFFYVLPRYGFRLPSSFWVGTLALGLHYATYCSEVYRAGIDAVEKGQWEAGTALNFSTYQMWVRIILPQAVPPMFPAFGNYLVAMFKESAQLLAITVSELMLTARVIGTTSFRFLEPITMAGILYFLISYPAALLVQRMEARFARK